MNIALDEAITQHANLIQVLRLHPGLDKNSIAEKNNVSAPTVYKALEDLRKREIIYNDDSVNPNIGQFMGISIGATVCKIVFLNFDFKEFPINCFKKELQKSFNNKSIVEDLNDICNYIYFKTPTSFSELKEYLNVVLEKIKIFIEESKLNLLAIGISSTGIVDEKNQIIYQSHNLPYLEKRNISDFFYIDKKDFLRNNNIPFFLIQNSTASIISEKNNLYTSNPEYSNSKNIASIYLEYGLGAGFIVDGKLFTGENGYAGEIGHTPTPASLLYKFKDFIDKIGFDTNSKCVCNCIGCLDHIMRSVVFNKSKINFKDMNSNEIRNFLESNPEQAQFLGTLLGYITNMLAAILNINLVVFTGKLYKSTDLLYKYIEQTTDESNLKFNRGDCKIYTSDKGTLSPALGAAMYSYYKKYSSSLDWN